MNPKIFVQPMKIFHTMALVALLLGGCAPKRVDTIHLQGYILGYDPSKSYEVRIVESHEYGYQLIDVIENEMIKDGSFDHTVNILMNHYVQLEVMEDDTVKAILAGGKGDYLKNNLTDELFYYRAEDGPRGMIHTVHGIKVRLDTVPERRLDLNLNNLVRPALKVEEDYHHIQGKIDTLPPKARLILIADGGYATERYEFLATDFDIRTDYRINFLDMYIESQYGWKRHLQRYDIKNMALHY